MSEKQKNDEPTMENKQDIDDEVEELRHENALLKDAVTDLCQTITLIVNVMEKMQKVYDD